MATDSGLGYLSGLLRAGAEPLGPVGRAPRRGAAAAPRANTPPRASSSYPPAPSERAGAGELSHSLERDAPESGTHSTAIQTSVDDASAGHTTPADSAETTLAERPVGFGASHTAPPDTSLDEDVAESAAPFAPPSHAPRCARVSPTPSSDTDADVENRPREKDAGYVPPSLTPDTRSAAGGHESITPPTSRVAEAAGEVRAFPEEETRSRPHSEEEIRIGETEQTAVVTQHAADAASEGERPSGTPRLLAVEWSPAPLQEGTIDSAASRAEVARAYEDTSATHDADVTTTDAAPFVPGTSPARGLAARPARVFHASAFEGDVARDGASAKGVADSTAYTLEAHIEHLRALMQASGAEPSGGTGEGAAAPAQSAAACTAKETRARADGERRTHESPKSDSRHSVVLESPEQPGATAGRRTSATEPPATLGQKTGAGAATDGQERKRSPGHLSPSRPADSHANTPARIGVAPQREGATPGGTRAGGARAPKLTINRLDVQVVERANPSPPARPATPAPAKPSQPDPWGAQDRHFLGRFFY